VPQSSIEHHRRLLFLLSSTKSQLHLPLAAARTDSVGTVQPSDAALVEGFRWAFCAGAALAVLGALAAMVLIRAKASGVGKPRAEDLQIP
jgi:hypothetical protein